MFRLFRRPKIPFRGLFKPSASRVGSRGESRVARHLNNLDPFKYKVLNDVLIKINNGTSQVDHIILSIYGIFVIETKNYEGWIFGNENSDYWTQVIYDTKSKFRNPIKQNWSHIYALKKLLYDFKDIIYHPIVVFAGNAELKKVTSTIAVVYVEQLLSTIRSLSTIQHLNIDKIDRILKRIFAYTSDDRAVYSNHIYETQMNVKGRKLKESNLICPKCGSTLKLRDGRYGKFYGCSNYPSCRFTKSY